ncbi:MAG: LPP20 family lipoprotein [Deltaproteobacteria bacterium]|nr:LPP20 family lipoprotein [Deltaproteobacteria bacterium]
MSRHSFIMILCLAILTSILALAGGCTIVRQGNPEEMVTFRATGKGHPPADATSEAEAKLMAERAAIADGYRQLAERIKGMLVQSYTTLNRQSVSHDVIRIETEAYLRHAEVMAIRHNADRIVEADVKVSFQPSSGLVIGPITAY